MKTQSNTPPDGDFARYVEQLANRSLAQAKVVRTPATALGTGIDERGVQPPASAHGPMSFQSAQTEQAAPAANKVPDKDAVTRGVVRVLAIAWAGLLLIMLSGGTNRGVLPVIIFGGWAAYRLRRWLLPPDGVAGLKAALEDLARQQAKRNLQGKKKKP